MKPYPLPCAWCGGAIEGEPVTVRDTDRPELGALRSYFRPCGFEFCASCGFVATHDRGRMIIVLIESMKTADAMTRRSDPASWLAARAWERGRGGRWLDPARQEEGFIWTTRQAVAIQVARQAKRDRMERP